VSGPGPAQASLSARTAEAGAESLREAATLRALAQPREHERAAGTSRAYAFEPTPAVAESRARSRYVDCTLCRSDHSAYLFHRVGVRFVRCQNCGLVYVNPAGGTAINYFDMERHARLVTPHDRRLAVRDFERFLRELGRVHEQKRQRRIGRALLLGRSLPEFADVDAARSLGLRPIPIDDERFQSLALDSELAWAAPEFSPAPDVLILNELLEACADPRRVISQLRGLCGPATWFVITYANADSFPARMLRRYWPGFFDVKSVFFSTPNLCALMADEGFTLRGQFGFPTTRSARYVAERLSPSLSRPPLSAIELPLRTGHRVAIFEYQGPLQTGGEKLSIVLPVFNEARYVRDVIEALLRKQLKIERELVIVESNSSDGTRQIVREYEQRRGVRVIYEDRPRGKGHAVRAGLEAATGTIILIQDADFEYDIDDYDALLEPILQRRTSFVLGSRSLGLDDWKVRRFAHGALKGALMNVAQVVFAKTFNALYQQRITDVNTMFKVFRRECLEGFELEGNGFELDIELACKLVQSGHAPIEVPVNYVSRGFDEGKKIDFWRDAFPSYFELFRRRLS
jgi:ribosomal protein S27E